MTTEAWLLATGTFAARARWDEAIAGMETLRGAGLRPRLVVCASETPNLPEALPFDAVVARQASLAPIADSRMVREMVEEVAGKVGRPTLLVALTDDAAVEASARLAVAWEAVLVSGVRSWRAADNVLDCTCDGVASAGNERRELELRHPHVLTLSREFAAEGRPATHREAGATWTLDLPEPGRDVEVRHLVDLEPPAPEMSAAPIVVAGGLGLGSHAGVGILVDLADAIGGAVGGSRPIVDLGWLPVDSMIGATGRAVAPDLYIALGISGATQHVSSVRARRIISVNTDPAAPMTRLADLGLVGDVHEIAPALSQAIREYRR